MMLSTNRGKVGQEMLLKSSLHHYNSQVTLILYIYNTPIIYHTMSFQATLLLLRKFLN